MSKDSNDKKVYAERDSTIESMVPNSVWLTFTNLAEKRAYFEVTLEINKVKSILTKFYIPGLNLEEGIHLESHNLTWIVSKALSEQKAENELLKQELAAWKKMYGGIKYVQDGATEKESKP